MKKAMILSTLMILLFSLTFVFVTGLDLQPIEENKTIENITIIDDFKFINESTIFTEDKLDNSLDYKDFSVIPYLTNSTKLINYDWKINDLTKEFYPELKFKLLKPLTEFHWKVSALETNKVCKRINRYFQVCSREVLDFSTFENKNIITNKTINPILDKDKNILGYLISYYGLITNLDPTLELVYNSADDIVFNNQTEGSVYGARLDAPVLYMDFNKPAENYSNSALLNYTQDNSVYGNFGTLGDATPSTLPTHNSSCTAFSGSGGCYEFDGTDDYINIDDVLTNDLASTTIGTWSAWIKPTDATPSANNHIVTFGDANANAKISLYSDTPNGNLEAVGQITSGVKFRLKTDGNPFTNDVWTHVVIVHNGTEPVLYVDGSIPAQTFALSADKTLWFSDIAGLDKARIGNINWANKGETAFFDGSIDQVQIWDRDLSVDEISDLYNNQVDAYGKYSDSGDFRSLVFYNSTSIFWNTTFYMANSSGSGVDLTDANLVSYWALDENMLDGTGSNDGTCSACPVNSTGLSSDSYLFDGVDDFVNIDTAVNDLATTTTGTWSSWVKPVDATPSVAEYFISFGDTSATEYISLYITVQGKFNGISADSGTSQWLVGSDSAVFLDNTWTHIVLVQNGTEPILYVDGVAIAQTFTTSTDKTKWFSDLIGLDNGRIATASFNNAGDAYFFEGDIDEVLIYNDSLTATEIRDLYLTGLSQHASTNISLQTRTATSYNLSDSGLVSFWSFNSDYTDEMGLNDGTNNGSTRGEDYGVVGQGANFDGSSNSMDMTSAGCSGTPCSLSSWVKLNGSAGAVQRIVTINIQGVANNVISIYIDANEKAVAQHYDTDSELAISKTTLDDGAWHHVVGVFSANNNRKIYIDSVLENTNTVGQFALSGLNYTSIGDIAWNGGDIHHFNGAIDEVKIYNRSLSASEILDLYNLGSSHILWNEWSSSYLMLDGYTNTTNSAGNFFQFKSLFESNNTDVSPYLLNHTIEFGKNIPITDNTPPYFTTIPADETITYGDDWNGVYFDADDLNLSIDTYHVNDSEFTINSTGFLDDNGLLTAGIHTLNITVNDTNGNMNWTRYNLTVNKFTTALTLISSAGWSLTSAGYSTITGANCPTQLTCLLYEVSVSVSNPYTKLFSAGSYSFIYNATGNVNYTSDTITNTLLSQINATITVSNETEYCIKNKFGYNYLDNARMRPC